MCLVKTDASLFKPAEFLQGRSPVVPDLRFIRAQVKGCIQCPECVFISFFFYQHGPHVKPALGLSWVQRNSRIVCIEGFFSPFNQIIYDGEILPYVGVIRVYLKSAVK